MAFGKNNRPWCGKEAGGNKWISFPISFTYTNNTSYSYSDTQSGWASCTIAIIKATTGFTITYWNTSPYDASACDFSYLTIGY